MEKIKQLLSEFSKENSTPIRGTSDLSPLEIWLISKLAKHEEFFDGVSIKIEKPTFYYNSTETIGDANQKIVFSDKSIEYLLSLKSKNIFLNPPKTDINPYKSKSDMEKYL